MVNNGNESKLCFVYIFCHKLIICEIYFIQFSPWKFIRVKDLFAKRMFFFPSWVKVAVYE